MKQSKNSEFRDDKLDKLIAEIKAEAEQKHSSDERTELATAFIEELKLIIEEDKEPFDEYRREFEEVEKDNRPNAKLERKGSRRIAIFNSGALFIYLAGISAGSAKDDTNAGYVFGIAIHNLEFAHVAAGFLFFVFAHYIVWFWRFWREEMLLAGMKQGALEMADQRQNKYDEVGAAIDDFANLDPDMPDKQQGQISNAFSTEGEAFQRRLGLVRGVERWASAAACMASTVACFYFLPTAVEAPFIEAVYISQVIVFVATGLCLAAMAWLGWVRSS